MRFLFVAALGSFSLFALACGSTVIDGDDDDGPGGGSDCGSPPPPGSGGFCPPSYECVDGQWQDAGACPEPECPANEPYNDVACLMEGQDCQYSVEYGCDEDFGLTTYRCMDGLWVQLSNYCQPPVECPAALPIDGSDCTGWEYAYNCYYDVTVPCSADQDVADAWCDTSTWTWSVEMPASCEGCLYADAATCEADAACRWLVPGCGENPLPVEGCAPVDDCAPDSCTGGATCSTYDANPCWNALCDGCSSPVSICEMIVDGGE